MRQFIGAIALAVLAGTPLAADDTTWTFASATDPFTDETAYRFDTPAASGPLCGGTVPVLEIVCTGYQTEFRIVHGCGDVAEPEGGRYRVRFDGDRVMTIDLAARGGTLIHGRDIHIDELGLLGTSSRLLVEIPRTHHPAAAVEFHLAGLIRAVMANTPRRACGIPSMLVDIGLLPRSHCPFAAADGSWTECAIATFADAGRIARHIDAAAYAECRAILDDLPPTLPGGILSADSRRHQEILDRYDACMEPVRDKARAETR